MWTLDLHKRHLSTPSVRLQALCCNICATNLSMQWDWSERKYIYIYVNELYHLLCACVLLYLCLLNCFFAHVSLLTRGSFAASSTLSLLANSVIDQFGEWLQHQIAAPLLLRWPVSVSHSLCCYCKLTLYGDSMINTWIDVRQWLPVTEKVILNYYLIYLFQAEKQQKIIQSLKEKLFKSLQCRWLNNNINI